jgi:hypothetical protein
MFAILYFRVSGGDMAKENNGTANGKNHIAELIATLALIIAVISLIWSIRASNQASEAFLEAKRSIETSEQDTAEDAQDLQNTPDPGLLQRGTGQQPTQ